MLLFTPARVRLLLPSGHSAQNLVEYALILALVAIVAAVGLLLIGDTLNGVYYSRIISSLNR
jgi:Flp pilus assembly pilin Flp